MEWNNLVDRWSKHLNGVLADLLKDGDKRRTTNSEFVKRDIANVFDNFKEPEIITSGSIIEAWKNAFVLIHGGNYRTYNGTELMLLEVATTEMLKEWLRSI